MGATVYYDTVYMCVCVCTYLSVCVCLSVCSVTPGLRSVALQDAFIFQQAPVQLNAALLGYYGLLKEYNDLLFI